MHRYCHHYDGFHSVYPETHYHDRPYIFDGDDYYWYTMGVYDGWMYGFPPYGPYSWYPYIYDPTYPFGTIDQTQTAAPRTAVNSGRDFVYGYGQGMSVRSPGRTRFCARHKCVLLFTLTLLLDIALIFTVNTHPSMSHVYFSMAIFLLSIAACLATPRCPVWKRAAGVLLTLFSLGVIVFVIYTLCIAPGNIIRGIGGLVLFLLFLPPAVSSWIYPVAKH